MAHSTCDTDVVSREHLVKKEQKEEQLSAFVQSLQDVGEVSLSFEDNVETVMRENKPDKPVKDKVREAMECQHLVSWKSPGRT